MGVTSLTLTLHVWMRSNTWCHGEWGYDGCIWGDGMRTELQSCAVVS